MSSFLDSTGLDRLATKLKAYFMKKPTTASSSSYPLVGYDATNNVGKYNSDITLDMANKWISALSKGVYHEYELGITTDSVSDDLNTYNNPITSAGITVLRIGDDVKANVQNKPVDNGGCCVVVSNAGGYAHQLYFATNGSNTVYMRERYKASWTDWFSADLYGYTGVGGCVVSGTGGYYPIMRFTSSSGTLAWHATALVIPHSDSNVVPQRVEIDLAIRSSNYVGYATQKSLSDYTNFNLRAYNNSGVVTVYLYCTNQMYGTVSIKCDQISHLNHYHRLTGVEAYRDSRNQQSVPSGTLLTG